MPEADFWNKTAPRYARMPVADPAAFDRKIEITVSHLTPSSVVLDIGCGTGSLALRLAPHAAQVHGLDVSEEMIRIAQGKAQAAGAANVRFHVGAFDESFQALPDESLDMVCAFSLLHLLGDRAAALRHISRLLKPGGWFVSSTVCLRELPIRMGPLLTVMHWLGKAPRVATFSKAQLVREIEEAGFVALQQPDVGAKKTIAFIVARKSLPTTA